MRISRTIIGTLGSACLAVAAYAAVPEKIPAVVFEDVFDPGASHVQGACCSDDAVYLSQRTALYKFGWDGKLLAKVAVTNHTGDICFHDGKVYTSVCLYEGENRGRIQVFDGKDLAFVRESPGFPRPADGSLSFYEYKDGSFIERAQQAVPHSRRQGRKPRRGRLHAGVFSHVFGA